MRKPQDDLDFMPHNLTPVSCRKMNAIIEWEKYNKTPLKG